MAVTEYKKGDILYEIGETHDPKSNTLLVVTNGIVGLERPSPDDRDPALVAIATGRPSRWSDVVDLEDVGAPRRNSTAVVLTPDAVVENISFEPDAIPDLLSHLGLHLTGQEIILRSFGNNLTLNRVANALDGLSQSDEGGLHVTADHSTIGALAGRSRGITNNHIGNLRRRGILAPGSRGNRFITILDIHELQRLGKAVRM